MKEKFYQYIQGLQDTITSKLEEVDGKARFQQDLWERPGGGGGRTRILSNGDVIEKGGVNFSAVFGKTPDKIKEAMNLPESDFFATGVSIVLHPKNPFVPIIHMNVRYFEMSDSTWWFGGGIDLTPHYIEDFEAALFHRELKMACDKHDPAYYPEFKKWADDYFYIKHRKETRGIGGIFFDHLNHKRGKSKEELFDFVKEIGDTFAPIYTKLAKRKKNTVFGEKEKQWQLLRRGRYVEFNLVYDRGTKFGLDTDGRVESILMSLPETAGWTYNYQAEQGSEEEKTLEMLKNTREWTS